MGATILNDPAAGNNAATYPSQSRPDKEDIDNLVAGTSGSGVLTGGVVTTATAASAPTFINSSAAAGTTSLVITAPASITSGDYLLACIGYYVSAGSSITPPTGWTQLAIGAGSDPNIVYYGKVATSSEPASYTFTNSATSNQWVVGEIRHYSASNGYDVSSINTAGGGLTFTCPSVTTTGANEQVVMSAWEESTITGLSGSLLHQTTSLETWSSGQRYAFVAGDLIKASAGATGTQTGTQSSNSAGGQATIALKSGPVGLSIVAAAGAVSLLGVQHTFSATGNITLSTADPTNPRVDLIVWDSTSGVIAITGTAAAVPAWPTYTPATQVLLAAVTVPASATTLTSSNIVDKRVILPLPSPEDLRSKYRLPANAFAETFPNDETVSGNTTAGTGILFLAPIYLPAGVTVGHIAYVSATASSGDTHWWFGLFDSALNALAFTADQTTTAWAAHTAKSLAIATTAAGASTTFTTTYEGLYYIGVMWQGTTEAGKYYLAQTTDVVVNSAKSKSGLSGGPPTFPYQVTTPTAATANFYGYVTT